mgnify:CR=1 FL=1
MMAYITRITQLRKAIQQHKNCIIITERSILTDKNVFAKMLHDDKKIEEINYNIYKLWALRKSQEKKERISPPSSFISFM